MAKNKAKIIVLTEEYQKEFNKKATFSISQCDSCDNKECNKCKHGTTKELYDDDFIDWLINKV